MISRNQIINPAFLGVLCAAALVGCGDPPPGGSGGSGGSGNTGGMDMGGAGGMISTGGMGGTSNGGSGGSGGSLSCGNGKRDAGENCDGQDLGGATCTSALAAMAVGNVTCSADCQGLDVSACSPIAATKMAVGLFHMCAILNDETVKCWGDNTFGQSGVGDTMRHGDAPGEMGSQLRAVDFGQNRKATAITSGGDHLCALLDDQTVKCWGFNDKGQLGQGDVAPRGDAMGEMGDNLPPVNLGAGKKALAVANGTAHSCAILDDNSIKCWGNNGEGKLGIGDLADRGDAANEMGDMLPTVNLGTGRTAKAIAPGVAHTCALLDNGSVKCWGHNHVGQLGLGDMLDRGDAAGEMGDVLPAVNLGTGRTALAIASGQDRTCAILDNHSLKCWGSNSSGALGQGDTSTRGDQPGEMGDNLPAINLGTGRTVEGVTIGRNHVCALLDNATVKCWGGSVEGQLGLGDTMSRGHMAGTMGDALPAVDLGAGRTAQAIFGLYDNTCALLDNGALKCWGKNSYGALGLGDTTSRGDGPNEMGDNLPAVRLAATQRVRNGFLQADGTQSFSNTCDFSPTNTLDCNPTAFPFTPYPLPPAGVTVDAGAHIADRYGAAFWNGKEQKLLLGYVQSDGKKEWSQVCDLSPGTAIQCPTGAPTLSTLPPPGLNLPQGTSIGGRYMFVFRHNGVQKLRNGFVQSDGAQSFFQTCDIFDGAIDCEATTHPFSTNAVPTGLMLAAGTYVSDRYAFVYIADGAQKLRNGFMQSDGAQSLSQTCDIGSSGLITCGSTFNAFPMPPTGIPMGTMIHHRFGFTYLE